MPSKFHLTETPSRLPTHIESNSDCESPSLKPQQGTLATLPRDVGWLLVTAGILGEIAPGVIGTPFWIVGTLVLWPNMGRRVEKWLSAVSPGVYAGGIRQVERFLDDLERRYPHKG